MKFALIYSYDPTQTGPTHGEVADWLALEQALKDAGAYVYEAGLQSSQRAQTVRIRGDEVTTSDGPVVGSNGEVVAGFWVIDVENAGAALEWAQRLPTASYGEVEVRPVVEFEG
jgi:hypothetical protein